MKGYRYRQEAWLKPYIEDLVEEQPRTKVPFIVNYYKLLANSTYGYTLKSVRNYRSIELVREAETLRKLVAKPNFKSFTVFGPNLIAVEMGPIEIQLTQCIFAGATILDTSKMTLLKLFWRLNKEQFQDIMDVFFTDTDSLCVAVTSPAINSELLNLMDILDTSGLSTDHPLLSREFARAPGRLKLKYGDLNMLSITGLRSEVYALTMERPGGE